MRRLARETVAHSAGRAQRVVGVEAALRGSALALHWHLARDHILGIHAHSATHKNTVVLAASLRSALRVRCWCCTTALCLWYLGWCRQHRIIILFQDNGTRLRRAGRLRQIFQDSMRASRRLPGPQTRVLCCTFRAAYARSVR